MIFVDFFFLGGGFVWDGSMDWFTQQARAFFFCFSFIQLSVCIIHFSTLLLITLLLPSVANWLLFFLAVCKSSHYVQECYLIFCTSCSTFSSSSGLVNCTNLESTVTCCLILKLHSKNLQNMLVIFLVFVDFHCFVIIIVDMISAKITFCRTVLDS